jgi:hypothetical protein
LSSRARSWVGVAAGVVGGAIGGGCVAFVIILGRGRASAGSASLASHGRGEVPREAPREDRRLDSLIAAGAADKQRIQQLEARLGRLEDSDGGAQQAKENIAPLAPPPTVAEYAARQAKLIADHRLEAVDSQWAPATTRAFSQDFAAAKAQGTTFEIDEVDCRTTSCVLTASWATKDEALNQYEYLLHYPMQAGCARQVLVSEQQNAAGRFEASIVYDCTDWRADGAVLAHAAAPPLFRATAPAP